MKTYERITDLIGGTPLLKLTNYIKDNDLGADVYGKLEYFNPAGSVKDRIAIGMIEAGTFNPSLKLCLSICWALDMTLNDLFWEEKPSEETEK